MESAYIIRTGQLKEYMKLHLISLMQDLEELEDKMEQCCSEIVYANRPSWQPAGARPSVDAGSCCSARAYAAIPKAKQLHAFTAYR